MAAEEAIVYSLLSGESTLTALVDTRIEPDPPEDEETLPFVMYSRADTNITEISLNGSDRPHLITWRIDVWANRAAEMHDVLDAVHTALEGREGVYSGYEVQFIKEQGRDTIEDPDQKKFNGMMTFLMIV